MGFGSIDEVLVAEGFFGRMIGEFNCKVYKIIIYNRSKIIQITSGRVVEIVCYVLEVLVFKPWFLQNVVIFGFS